MLFVYFVDHGFFSPSASVAPAPTFETPIMTSDSIGVDFVHDCIKDDTFIMNSVLIAEAANPVATVR